MPWSRSLSWCPCSQGPGRWPVAVGGMGRPCRVLSGVRPGWRRCGLGLPAVQQPGAGRGTAAGRVREAEGAGWRAQDGLRAAEGYSIHEPPGAARCWLLWGRGLHVGGADLRRPGVSGPSPPFPGALLVGARPGLCCRGVGGSHLLFWSRGGCQRAHNIPEAGCPHGSRAGGEGGAVSARAPGAHAPPPPSTTSAARTRSQHLRGLLPRGAEGHRGYATYGGPHGEGGGATARSARRKR